MGFFPAFKKREKAKRKNEENEFDRNECARCLEQVNTNVVFEPAEDEQSGKISRFWLDKMCVIAFPMLYIIFNVSYWSYYA